MKGNYIHVLILSWRFDTTYLTCSYRFWPLLLAFCCENILMLRLAWKQITFKGLNNLLMVEWNSTSYMTIKSCMPAGLAFYVWNGGLNFFQIFLPCFLLTLFQNTHFQVFSIMLTRPEQEIHNNDWPREFETGKNCLQQRLNKFQFSALRYYLQVV